MESSFNSFLVGLNDLKHYIAGFKIENQLLSARIKDKASDISEFDKLLFEYQKHISKALASKKRFIYNTIIVSLYGFFEQYIESLISSYVKYLNKIIPDYGSLPKSIKKHHIDLSFGLINQSKQQRSRIEMQPAEIISNLNSCIDNGLEYHLNSFAFSQHTANFRTEVIDEIFLRVGIQKASGLVQKSDVFNNFFRKKDPARRADQLKPDNVFYFVNDLAVRRNEVAHGFLPDEVLSGNILLDYISFFENYSSALYDVVKRSSLPFLAQHHGIKLGKPLAVYDNSIICFTIKKLKVQTGDILISQPANESCLFLGGKIQELQVDRKEYYKIKTNSEKNIAMRVEFKAKENQLFFLLPAKAHILKVEGIQL